MTGSIGPFTNAVVVVVVVVARGGTQGSWTSSITTFVRIGYRDIVKTHITEGNQRFGVQGFGRQIRRLNGRLKNHHR